MEKCVAFSIDIQLFADPSKTEKATPRRRRKAREEGQISYSRELTSASAFFGAILLMYFYAPTILKSVEDLIRYFVSVPLKDDLSQGTVVHYAQLATTYIFKVTFPLGLSIIGITVIVGLLQTRFLIAPRALRFDLNRINPIKGFQRLFSIRSIIELIKSLLKVTFVGFIAYTVMKSHIKEMISAMNMGLSAGLVSFAKILFEIGFKTGLAMLAIALFDYFYQHWEYERSIKMTKQEVKEEYKDIEGNPQIKSRQKEIMARIARQRMMQRVPEAEVVITNPLHIAVALGYKPEKMNAPIVFAKGAGELASRIKAIARKYDVPIVENKPLAHALYSAVEVGEEIPLEFYQAVAEVLAYVYTIDKSKRVPA